MWRLENGQAALVAYEVYGGPRNQYGKIPGVIGRSEFGLLSQLRHAPLVPPFPAASRLDRLLPVPSGSLLRETPPNSPTFATRGIARAPPRETLYAALCA